MNDHKTSICKLCNEKTNYLFSMEIAQSIQANYYECKVCKTLQSYHLDNMSSNELKKFYESSDSLDLDNGAAWRQYCILHRLKTLFRLKIIRSFSLENFKVLDFGAGSGFVASSLKFKLGWDVYAYEPYTKPYFSTVKFLKNIDEVIANKPYNLIVASEVFEHLNKPIDTLNIIRDVLYKDWFYVFVTTGLYIPGKRDKSWTYLAPMTGQHTTFYSTESMKKVGKILGASKIYQIGAEYEWLFAKYPSRMLLLHDIYNIFFLNFLKMQVKLGLLPRLE